VKYVLLFSLINENLICTQYHKMTLVLFLSQHKSNLLKKKFKKGNPRMVSWQIPVNLAHLQIPIRQCTAALCFGCQAKRGCCAESDRGRVLVCDLYNVKPLPLLLIRFVRFICD
jgi:hypothetical protein